MAKWKWNCKVRCKAHNIQCENHECRPSSPSHAHFHKVEGSVYEHVWGGTK